MKHLVMLLICVLTAASTAVAQEDPVPKQPPAEASEVQSPAVTEDVQQPLPLEALDWMVGQWVDRGENSTITTECSWTKNGKFLSRSFRVSNRPSGIMLVVAGCVDSMLSRLTFVSEDGSSMLVRICN